MTRKEALTILSQDLEDFKVGEEVYYAQYEPRVIKVKIVAKRESKIGLQPCYSLKSDEFNKIIHTPLCYIFRKFEDAEKCWRAIKIVKELCFREK